MVHTLSSMVECILAPLNNEDHGAAHGIRVINEAAEDSFASYIDLAHTALSYCSALAQLDVQENDLVMLAHPASIEYIGLLMGCVLRGALPCTVPALGKRSGPSQNSTVEIASRIYQPKVLFVPDASASLAHETVGGYGVRVVDSNQLNLAASVGGASKICSKRLTDPHHVQLTSGSVSYPKAALLSHQNVIDNTFGIGGAVGYGVDKGDGSATWLPMHHDMGLLTLISNYVYKSPLLIMQPTSFIRNPLGWLKRIAQVGATTTSAPTFGLRYCVRRFNAKTMQGVDLSGIRNIFVGAERVDMRTLEEFAQTFAPYGLKGSTLQPCYGMAESTLAVTMQHVVNRENGERVLPHVDPDNIDTTVLAERRIAAPADGDSANRIETILSVGTPIAGMEYEIRNEDGRKSIDREAGEIFIRGTSTMLGYLPSQKMSTSAGPDANGWFSTGDIGYTVADQLFILGRKKEIIIIRGCNYFPHEIEEILAEHSSIVRGGCAAVGVHDDTQGTEQLVVLTETQGEIDEKELRANLQSLLIRNIGFAAHDIVFVENGELPRTTSGKLQHFLCKELYIAGALRNAPDEASQTALLQSEIDSGNDFLSEAESPDKVDLQ